MPWLAKHQTGDRVTQNTVADTHQNKPESNVKCDRKGSLVDMLQKEKEGERTKK